MTLIEMTVVILVLMSLITLLFIGARAWKNAADRAACIVQIQEVQKAVRSHANLYGFSPADNAPGLLSQIVGPGRYVEMTPVCPGGGSYTFGQAYGVNTIPPVGTLYLECSLAVSEQHEPENHLNW